MTMAVSRRFIAILFTIGLHAVLVGLLLLVPRQGSSAPEAVYQVSLADFSTASGTASSELPARAESPSPPTAQTPPPEVSPPAMDPVTPTPSPPEEKVISPKKVAEPEKKAAKPQKTPPRPQPATTSATERTEPSSQAASNAGAENGPRNVGGFSAYSADKVDQIPAIARKVMPDYPSRARRLDLQGRVIVRLVVDTSGEPQACAIQEANPTGYFEDAALDAARRTRFTPGKLRGQAVNTVVLLPFTFSLR